MVVAALPVALWPYVYATSALAAACAATAADEACA